MTRKQTIHLIAAARPNFMKIAPLYHALAEQTWAEPMVIHTGQHYDLNMSDEIFEDLGLSAPDIHLGIGSGTHAEQTGRVMMAYEKVLLERRPDLVVVVGDVNSTLAATLAAAKLEIPVAHLESGLRSRDRSMPEEINRVATDALADLLWTPSPDGDRNLRGEGIPEARIERVGNIMIDSLERVRPRIEADGTRAELELSAGGYGLVTLHRPANVDPPETLDRICGILRRVSERIPLVFPVHPRTRKNLETAGWLDRLSEAPGLRLLPPVRYIAFMNLVFQSALVVTDSGGIQEETTYLGIPCFTLRPNTERPITVERGTNRLCDVENLEGAVRAALDGESRSASVPELWDGRTAGRVVDSIRRFLAIR
jgi:UDP-N-acetylglucosamine 2-epimerase (non-hydrolysing)